MNDKIIKLQSIKSISVQQYLLSVIPSSVHCVKKIRKRIGPASHLTSSERSTQKTREAKFNFTGKRTKFFELKQPGRSKDYLIACMAATDIEWIGGDKYFKLIDLVSSYI